MADAFDTDRSAARWRLPNRPRDDLRATDPLRELQSGAGFLRTVA